MGWTGDAIAGTPWFQRRKYLGMRMQQNNLQKEAGHLPTLMSVNHQSQHIQAFASKCNMFETQQQSHLIVPNNYMTSHLSFFLFKKFFLLKRIYHICGCIMIITFHFHRISIPQPKHIHPPPKLSPLETISFSMSVSQYLFCKVQSVLFSDSTCQ